MKYSELNNRANVKTAIQYGLDYRPLDKQQGLVIYYNNDEYVVHGKTNEVKLRTKPTNKLQVIGTEKKMTLIQFCKMFGLSKVKLDKDLLFALTTTIQFGKYKGLMLIDVAKLDENYINWAIAEMTFDTISRARLKDSMIKTLAFVCGSKVELDTDVVLESPEEIERRLKAEKFFDKEEESEKTCSFFIYDLVVLDSTKTKLKNMFNDVPEYTNWLQLTEDLWLDRDGEIINNTDKRSLFMTVAEEKAYIINEEKIKAELERTKLLCKPQETTAIFKKLKEITLN